MTSDGIRVRPLEPEIPADDPFHEDILERQEPVEVLASIIKNIAGPCVLAVDAPWGTGKTVYLRRLVAYLRLSGFRVAEFNAWETDFCGEPFSAMTAELLDALEETKPRTSAALENTRQAALEVLKRAVPGAIRLSTVGLLDIAPLLEEEIGRVLAASAEEQIEAYMKAKQSIVAFHEQLSALSAKITEESEGLPLVIVIDELDRCRPLYAIELLESAKHLFSVDGVVFVIALDRFELAESIKAVYGSSFDAEGYLRRFFDLDYVLPRPDREAFVKALVSSTGIPSYFERTKDDQGRQSYPVVVEMIRKLLGESSASLRDIAQAVHRLGVVLASLPDNKRTFALAATTLVVLRTLDPERYRRFTRLELSDSELLEQLFSRPDLARLRGQHSVDLFEAAIMRAAEELGGHSTVLAKLLQVSEREIPDGEEPPREVQRAKHLIHLASAIRVGIADRTVGFKYTLRRIELLSGELSMPKGDTTAEAS